MLKGKEKTALEVRIEREEIQMEGNINLIKDHEEIQEGISWEKLIACVKAKYLQVNEIKTVFGKIQEIASCDINLAIIEEKEQNLKDEKWIRQERLNSYEEIEGAKTSVLPQDIFVSQNNKTLKRQLILGRAGIGKSTLCQYLVYQWAKEGWWKDEVFKLLIWIPLRQLMNERAYPHKEPISLGKIVYEQYSEQLEQVLLIDKEKWVKILNNLISEHSAEILYVLDGFDEVANVCQLNDSQATHQTEIIRSLLNQKQVVITSRPHYIENYLTSQGIKIDRRLENMGLVNENIQDYIQHYSWKSPSQQKALQACLNSSSLMRGIAHIPINLALICHHWCTHQDIKALNFSMTHLYEKLLGDFLYEYLQKTFGKNYINFNNKNEEEILESKTVQPVLIVLEKLAFLQMQKNTLLISQAEVDELLKGLGVSREIPIFKKLLDEGLLVSLGGQEQYFEEKKVYSFIHLTFQEFLAARYIARAFKQGEKPIKEGALLEKEKPNQRTTNSPLKLFTQNHKYDLRYEIVWWFVAGLLKEHLAGLQEFFNILLAAPRELSRSYDVLLWLKALEESRLAHNLSDELKKSLIKEIGKKAQDSLARYTYISKEEWSKTFLKYLFSSPTVYEELGILQTEEAVRKTLDCLQWHPNLPSQALSMLVNLLNDKENDIKNLALTTLDRQTSFPSSVLNALIDLIKHKDWIVSDKVLTILERQANLPADILSKLINLLSDNNNDNQVRNWVGVVLDRQKNSSLEVLGAMTGLLRDKEKDVGNWVQSALSRQKSLPLDVLIILVTLLSNKDWNVREAAESALVSQKNLPPSAFIIVESLLGNTSIGIRISALHVLGNQTNLSPDVLNKMVHALRDPIRSVRKTAQFELNRRVDLPINILHALVNLLMDEEGDISESMQNILAHQTNFPPDILSVLVALLNDKEVNIRNSALIALSGQKNLLPDVLRMMMRLLNVKETGVSKVLQGTLICQKNLPLDILDTLISWLSDKDKGVSNWALSVLRNRKNFPSDILNKLVNLLRDEDREVSGWAWSTLDRQMISSDIFNALKNLLIDQDERVSSRAYFTLGRQANLPSDILSGLVNLLSNEEMRVRSLALRALSFQSNLPTHVLNEIVTLVIDKKGVYWVKGEEVNFIYRQLLAILDNSKLRFQLSSSPVLLSDVILKKTFSTKSIVYFKNNQSLIIQLGQQIKQIEIKDKKEFVQTFAKRRELWLDNKNTDYLLAQITKPLSEISLKETKHKTEQDVLNQNPVQQTGILNSPTFISTYQTQLMAYDNKKNSNNNEMDNENTLSNSNKHSKGYSSSS